VDGREDGMLLAVESRAFFFASEAARRRGRKERPGGGSYEEAMLSKRARSRKEKVEAGQREARSS